MARLLQVDEGVYREIAFGSPSKRLKDFIDGQIERQYNNLNDAGRQWLSRAKDKWEDISNSNAMRNIKAAARKILNSQGADVVCRLDDIGQFQHAKSRNRRYIMANTKVRNEYIKGRVDGYSGDYFDIEPGSVGDDHRDYRRVMDGIVQFKDCDDITEYTEDDVISYDAYYEADDEYDFGIEEEALDIEEQDDILFNWSFAENCIATGGDDFTSKSNGSL